MNEKDAIKDLFRDKLQSHEVMPSNAVWSSVSSSLGHSAASGFGAASFLKVAAAVVGVTTIGVVGYILLDTDKASPANTNTNTMTVAPIEATEVETSTIESNSISEGDKSILSNVPVVSPNSVGKKMITADLVQETQPEIIAAGCPFCNTMMTDGVKNKEKENDIEVKDIAELIATAEDL